MLVLSRQRDETIMIGDDIEVTVVDIRGDKVRLGSMPLKRSASIARKFTKPSVAKTKPRRRSSPKIFRVSERSSLKRTTVVRLAKSDSRF